MKFVRDWQLGCFCESFSTAEMLKLASEVGYSAFLWFGRVLIGELHERALRGFYAALGRTMSIRTHI